jgi:lipoprotein-anchoring transpeptidase ErfK/SrfK
MVRPEVARARLQVRRLVALTGLVAGAALLVGCGGEHVVPPPSGFGEQPEATTGPSGQPAGTADPSATAQPWTSFIASAPATVQEIDVYAEPDAPEPDRTISATDVVSLPGETPLTFLVVEQQEGWVEVDLPVRPNGTSGWVRAQDVTVSSTDYKVEVRLSEHRLLLHKAGEVVLDVPVGVGKDEVPTPGGVYYIKELLKPPDEGSIYGAFAYGLSGYSPVLQSFAGGQGVIGIHGTNDPSSIGKDASHGCIRMNNEDVTRLVEEFGLPLGTPVEILA